MKRTIAFILTIATLISNSTNILAYDTMTESTEAGKSVDSSLTLKIENIGGEPEALFSAWVPSELPIKMDLDGKVVTPSNAQILNGVEDKGIMVTDIKANVADDWSVKSYTENFESKEDNSKELALAFRGDEVQTDGRVGLSAGNWNIPKASYIDLDMQAKIPKQTEAGEKGTIATAEFTLDWSGDDESTEPLDKTSVYTIVIEDGEHGTISSKETLKTNKYSVVPELPSTVPDAQYRFVKWVNIENRETVKAGQKITTNIIIQPVFEIMETVSVTFIADEGGSLQGETEYEVLYGTKYSEINKPTAVADTNYMFDTFYRENEIPAVDEDIITKDTVYTARFIDISVPDGVSEFNEVTPVNYFSYDLLTQSELEALDMCTDGIVVERDYTPDKNNRYVAAMIIDYSDEYRALSHKPSAVVVPSVMKGIISTYHENYEGVYEYDDEGHTIGYHEEPYGEYPVVGIERLNYYEDGTSSIYIPDSVRYLGPACFYENASEHGIRYVRLPKYIDKLRYWTFQDCTELNNLVIPDRVTSVVDHAFSNCTSLKNIKLGSGLRLIDFGVFSNSGIENLVIPDNVTYIGDYNFSGTPLKTIKLSKRLSEVGNNWAFGGLTNLETITIPGSLKTTGSDMFASCSNLKSVNIEYGVENIQSLTFAGCEKLQYVNLPSSLKTLGLNAFAGCKSLKNIRLPDSIKEIDQAAFAGCELLQDVNIPSELEILGGSAFTQTHITSAHIPGTLKEISKDAFAGCTELSDVIIEDGVETIRAGAFAGCRSLKNIVIPRSVTTIEAGAFNECTGLKSIEISGRIYSLAAGIVDNYMTSLESVVISNGLTDIENNALSGIQSLKTVELPDTLETIGSNAFYNSGITDIIIPNNVTTIGNSAFSGCSNLSTIKLSENLSEISNGTFSNCSSLEEIVIPANVKNIGASAFSRCTNLKKVIINGDIDTIDAGAFSGCTNLTSIEFKGRVNTLGAGVFSGCTSLSELVIPEGVTKIDGGTFSGSGISEIELPSTLRIIESGAFSGCIGLTHLELPEGLTTINGGAFSGCINITTMSLPNTLVNLNSGAFDGLKGVKKIVIPGSIKTLSSGVIYSLTNLETIEFKEGVEVIDYGALSGMANLKNVVLANTIKTINPGAFGNCQKLGSIKLPSSLTETTSGSFSNCTNLAEIIFNDGLITIGSGTFASCTSLKNLIIPEGVKTIGSGAFSGCSELIQVSLPSTLETIEAQAFAGCLKLDVEIPDAVTTIGENAFKEVSHIKYNGNATGSPWGAESIN